MDVSNKELLFRKIVFIFIMFVLILGACIVLAIMASLAKSDKKALCNYFYYDHYFEFEYTNLTTENFNEMNEQIENIYE